MSCNGNHKKLYSLTECTKCFERSFASHEKSKYIVDNVNTRSICKSTHKVYTFLCEECWHFFESDLCHVTREKNPTWCPYCSHTKLCEYDDCTICFEKSFASHKKSAYLTDKSLNTRSIFKSSHSVYNFMCGVCDHEFESVLYSIVNNGNWCPFPCCSTGPKRLCLRESCESCYNHSFASHEKSVYITDKTINTRNIFKQHNEKISFTCENGHTFPSAICKVTSLTEPRWCPHCSKGRQYSLVSIQWLDYIGDLQHYLSSFHGEYRIPNTNYRADGYCEKTNTIYEFHGDRWHGNPKLYKPEDICPMNKLTYGELYKNTLKKKEYIISRGYNYVEIWESDWKHTQKTMSLWKKLASLLQIQF